MKAWSVPVFLMVIVGGIPSCRHPEHPTTAQVDALQLKRGAVISCGPSGEQFGTLAFPVSCSEPVRELFNLGVKLLHSFEYDEAEKVFAEVITRDPDCAMAYWGVAMSNFHPLWTPPTVAELTKGSRAVEIARSLSATAKEKDFIEAIASFYQDWETVSHRDRCLDFERQMQQMQERYPGDREVLIFYALALNAAVDPSDKTFARQKKAGAILASVYPGQPNHPGIIHYLIHTYDYPELAQLGLDAARKYATIAPSSAHALHMPSHIFTRLGLWDECVAANLLSVSSAKCYAEASGMAGHWDEELHGLDYLTYAYLQKGASDSAKMQWDYLKTIHEVEPVNFKVAYAYASIPSRYLLENHLWQEAANLELLPREFPWKSFPWQEAIVHFTRAIGSIHTGHLQKANEELKTLSRLRDTLVKQGDAYKAGQVDIQVKTIGAWIHLKEGREKEALNMMQLAAEMEDQTEKHPVTPGEVIPARELLGDMYLALHRPEKALAAYEADLYRHPNRFNTVYSAGLAAYQTGDLEKAESYFKLLAERVKNGASSRTEIAKSKQYLDKLKSKKSSGTKRSAS